MILWILFFLVIGSAMALDLGLFHRSPEKLNARIATAWSIVWISLSLLFSVVVYYGFEENLGNIGYRSGGHLSGTEAVIIYLSAYLLELSLSLDNIFVIAMIFSYFRVPGQYQHRILFWGILGALFFRAIMIFAGIALIQRFEWLIYLFGGFIIYLALKMWTERNSELINLRDNRILKWLRRILPITRHFHGQAFFIRRHKYWLATPLFLTLVMVEFTDILFALDSIPAVFAVTTDPFLVFTSNIFAILGLRSMYIMLASVLDRFRYLKYGIIAILLFVGLKMVSHGFIHLPAWSSLAFIGGSLFISILASLLMVEIPNEEDENHPEFPKV